MKKVTVADLKKALHAKGLSTAGLKADLLQRLQSQLPEEYALLTFSEPLNQQHQEQEQNSHHPNTDNTRKTKKAKTSVDDDDEAVHALYHSFPKNPSSSQDLDGLAFCEKLEIEPESLLAVIVSYFLKSPALGSFPQADFCQACVELGIGNLHELKRRIREWNASVIWPNEEFIKVYQFAFKWGIKLSKEEKVDLWKVFFSPAMFPEMEQWCEFWNARPGKIGKDDWNSFPKLILRLQKQSLKDVKIEDGAWPLAIEDFLHEMKIKKG